MGKDMPQSNTQLRKKAEQVYRANPEPEDIKSMSPVEARQTFHQLRVHQIELEMQNKELHDAEQKIMVTNSRYIDIFNVAPLGFLSMNQTGIIVETNLTASKMFAVSRFALNKQPFKNYIYKEDQDIFHLFQKNLFNEVEPHSCVLRLKGQADTIFWARLEMTVTVTDEDEITFLIVISNISTELQSNCSLSILMATNKAIINFQDKKKFLQDISRIIVEKGSYELAWFKFVDENLEKSLGLQAQYQHEDRETFKSIQAKAKRAQELTVKAVQDKKSLVSDVKILAGNSSLFDTQEYEYKFYLAVPLLLGDEAIGALVVHSSSINPFNEQLIEFFEELTALLVHTITPVSQ
jgi:PAS domain S-box-containing protein